MPPELRLEATIRGSVQGVGYRAFVVRSARSLGLVGWVANRSDGGVECVAEGSRTELERLAEVLRSGPTFAEVDDVDVRWATASGTFASFGIRAWGNPGD